MHRALVNQGRSVASGQWELEDLRHFTKTGRRVICAITTNDGYQHWVVVWKATRRAVFYMDPWEARNKSEDAERFNSRWISGDVERLGIVTT